jgi:glycosyltransferase involved in cell wall biosynthesis
MLQDGVDVAHLLMGPGIPGSAMLAYLIRRTPVVSTTIGCKGWNIIYGAYLLIADSPEQFAERTVRLLTDRQLYQHISANGRQLAEARDDWDVIARCLTVVYIELLAQCEPPKSIV